MDRIEGGLKYKKGHEMPNINIEEVLEKAGYSLEKILSFVGKIDIDDTLYSELTTLSDELAAKKEILLIHFIGGSGLRKEMEYNVKNDIFLKHEDPIKKGLVYSFILAKNNNEREEILKMFGWKGYTVDHKKRKEIEDKNSRL